MPKKDYNLGRSIPQIVTISSNQANSRTERQDPIQIDNPRITSDINNQNCSHSIVLIIMFIAYFGL